LFYFLKKLDGKESPHDDRLAVTVPTGERRAETFPMGTKKTPAPAYS